MKKIIVAMGLCFTVGAYAVTPAQSLTPPAVTTSPDKNTTQQPMATEPPPVDSEVEKMGSGSGDDVDLDEADPANDDDPEAEDVSTPPVKS